MKKPYPKERKLLLAPRQIVECKDCGHNKIKNRAEKSELKSTRGYIFRDDNGRRWTGKRCPECCDKYKTKWARIKGHKPIDEVGNHAQKKGRKSEHIARKYFENMGFRVEMTSLLGPDLKISKGEEILTCEVKTAKKHKTRWKTYLRTARVEPARQNDDLIAVVFPDNIVHVEKMSEWLRGSPPNGQRYVDKLWEAQK